MWRWNSPIRLCHGLAVVLLLFSSVPAISPANVEILKFSNRAEELRYKKIIEELRCLVCQNQNLADSNADLAQDLRQKTYDMIRAGRSDADVINYMVTRYGDFVLYRPPLKSSTMLLWAGPILLLALSLGVLWRMIRQQHVPDARHANLEQRARIRQLLGEDEQS